MSRFAKASARSFRVLLASVSLVALSGTAACVSSGESSESEQARLEQQAEQQAERHRGPVSVVVEAALEHGELNDQQQQAISAIGEAHAATADREALREQMRTAAADVVRAGTSDSDAFDDAVEQASDALSERIAATGQALKGVHALLDSSQRQAVADALDERMQQRWAKRDRPRGEGIKRVAGELMLSTMQLDKIKAAFKAMRSHNERRSSGREQISALIEAFRGDDFAATLDAFQDEKQADIRTHMNKAGSHTDTVLAILNDDQRDLLAELIEQGPRSVLLGKEADSAE